MRALALAVLVLAVAVPSASADTYWNVWQAWLPDSSGDRAKHSLYCLCGADWYVRMSWTVNSHVMYFSFIFNDGSWYTPSSDGGIQITGPYDRYWRYVDSNVAKAGCQNPGGLATVWVNCRNASAL